MLRSLLRRRLRTLGIVLRLPISDKGMLLETLVLLTLARLVVLLLPFRWVARELGREEAQTPERGGAAPDKQVHRIGLMVRKTARNVPWTSKCLDQALAAKFMLTRRRIPTTVYFGVNHDEQGQLAAHAWLRSGSVYVTGGATRERFAVINTFAEEMA